MVPLGGTRTAHAAILLVLATLAGTAGPALAHHWEPVQPGAYVETPSAICTMNFVFRGADGDLYIGTSGHCTETGERARTDVPNSVQYREFGTTVYKHEDTGLEEGNMDIALIDIDERWEDRVSPQVRAWGGPTGTDTPSTGDVTLHYGHANGFGRSEATRARVGVVAHSTADQPGAFLASQLRPSATFFGDSGSPILDDQGRAVGVLSGTGGPTGVAFEDQRLEISSQAGWSPTMPAIMDHLAANGYDVELVTGDFASPIENPLEHVTGRGDETTSHCLSELRGGGQACFNTDVP